MFSLGVGVVDVVFVSVRSPSKMRKVSLKILIDIHKLCNNVHV
jgi:hypothetical protein